MGELVDRIGLRMLVDGDGIADNFKNNSLYFYNKYQKSDKDVFAIDVKDLMTVMFFHLHYLNDSNWMKWSPIFVTNYKKIGNKIIVFGVNFNFIPLEIRAFLFDEFITEEDLDQNKPLNVSYEGMYNELIKFGYEYSIVEYDVRLIKLVHRIDMSLVPRFLMSGHPKNKYDAKKLYQIWKAKIKTRNQRNSEMSQALITDFFEVSDEINENYKVLKNHITRLQNSLRKYGSQS